MRNSFSYYHETAFFSCVNFAWSGCHLRQKRLRHSCTHLSVAASITATVYCTAYSAARLVTSTSKFNHVTPVLHDLHWLLIRQWILFKLAMIVFKCLHSLALLYLADDCVLASAAAGRRHLLSADTMTLLLWQTRTVIGARDFTVLAAAIWNSLPATLRMSPCSVQTFVQKVKTFYASATM